MSIKVNEDDDFLQKVLIDGFAASFQNKKTYVEDISIKKNYCIHNFKLEFVFSPQKNASHRRLRVRGIDVGYHTPKGKNLPAGTFSYLGNGTTCGDFVLDFERWQTNMPSPFDLVVNRTPLVDVERKRLLEFVNIYRHMSRFDRLGFLQAVVTDKRGSMPPVETNALSGIMSHVWDDISKGIDFVVAIRQETVKAGQNQHHLTTVLTKNGPFVLGIDGHVPVLEYTLGGMEYLQQKRFLKTISPARKTPPERDDR